MRLRSFSTVNEAAHEAARTEWAARTREVEEHLQRHTRLLEAVRMQITPLWETLAQGKTLARKPSYSLRLFGVEARTLVGISPLYIRRTQTVVSSNHRVEVLGEIERYLSLEDPRPFYQLQRRLILEVFPHGVSWKLLGQSAVADLEALVEILADFLGDPGTVLRRSSTYCAICGRHLTDGQSRARGIGPECLHHVSTWMAYAEPVFAGEAGTVLLEGSAEAMAHASAGGEGESVGH
jgi:hypothetical protein